MKIVLASGSPRRKELLEMLRVKDLEVCPARGRELPHPELTPPELVAELSRCKAAEVAADHPEDVVIGADTVVVLDDKVLGKPRTASEAVGMLRALGGRGHTVLTGLCAIRGDTVLSHVEATRVYFRPLTDAEIERYVVTGEPMDKAGAYGAQGLASVFVERLEGDFFNVMGLPLCALGNLLKQLGVELL